jgi:hypothetical protein
MRMIRAKRRFSWCSQNDEGRPETMGRRVAVVELLGTRRKRGWQREGGDGI